MWATDFTNGHGWGCLLGGGGNPVVSRCSTTGYRPAPLPGCDFIGVWFPAVSLVASLNRRLQAVIPAG